MGSLANKNSNAGRRARLRLPPNGRGRGDRRGRVLREKAETYGAALQQPAKSESGSDDDDERRRRKKHKSTTATINTATRGNHGTITTATKNATADDNEDDYVARSRRRKQELKQNPRVPYLHGPQEDANPIMDFIIKSHKYRNGAAEELQQRARSGGALAAARPDGGTLAQVLLDTKAFNQTEDEKQLDGAHKQLAARGSMLRPILLSQKLSMVEEDALRTSGGDEDATFRGGGSSYGHSCHRIRSSTRRRRATAMCRQRTGTRRARSTGRRPIASRNGYTIAMMQTAAAEAAVAAEAAAAAARRRDAARAAGAARGGRRRAVGAARGDRPRCASGRRRRMMTTEMCTRRQ